MPGGLKAMESIPIVLPTIVEIPPPNECPVTAKFQSLLCISLFKLCLDIAAYLTTTS